MGIGLLRRWGSRGLRYGSHGGRAGLGSFSRWDSGGIRGGISAVAPIPLGNITVIHGITCLIMRR